ncbi:MAG: flagellar motor protein MotB [Rhodothalassiaceae bacterium]
MTPRRVRADTSWMVSFADLLALMLTFFALLFSMRTVPFPEWRALIEAVRADLNMPELAMDPPVFDPGARAAPTLAEALRALSLDYLKALIRQADLEDDPAAGGLMLWREDDRLVLSIPQSVMFEPASAVLRAPAKDLVMRLASRLELLPNSLQVRAVGQSHMMSGPYPSPWELAVDQARGVAQTLVQGGYSGPVPPLAVLDWPEKSVLPQLPDSLQKEQQRRIDLIIMNYRRGSDDVSEN